MKQWWSRQSPRRQLQLASVAVVAGVALWSVGVLLPLHRQEAALALALQDGRQALASLQPLVLQLEAQRAAGVSSGEDLTTRLTRSLQQQGLQPSRMQQGGDADLQLRIDNADYAQVMAWLASVESLPGIALQRVTLTQGTAATTTVTASVTRYR